MADRLSGTRILILETREEAQFSKLLAEQGAEVVQCPMFTIQDAPDPSPVEAWIRRAIDKPFDDLVQKGRTTSDQAERTKIYTQAQQIFAQQLPFSPIAHSTVYQPVSKKVIDMRIEPLGYLRFDGVGMQ